MDAKAIVRMLESLLGENGTNVLGKYLINGTSEVPAIAIRLPSSGIVRKMKPNSGIECTVEPVADTETLPQSRGVCITDFYTVTLDQYNPSGDFKKAIRAVYAVPKLRPLNAPLIRPRIELPNNKGETPARMVLFIPDFDYQPHLY